jgi:beta-lactamase regulating signal transducer with metallopeptidase domain
MQVSTVFLGILGVIVASILFTIVYIIWDERTRSSLTSPEEEKRINLIIEVLREYSKNHPDLYVILDKYGLL